MCTPPDAVVAVEIGQRPGDPQHAVEPASGQAHRLGRLRAAASGRCPLRPCDLLDHRRRARRRWWRRPARPMRGIALRCARRGRQRRAGRPRPSPRAGGGRMRSAAVTAGTSMTRSMRSRSGPEMRAWYSAAQRSFGAAPAGIAGLGGLAAAARVHRRDELEARGIDDAVVGARDQHLARSPAAGAARRGPGAGTPAIRRGRGRRDGRARPRPGRACSPPPTSAAIEAEWCGARNGRRSVSAPPASSPATEWTIETSSSSRGASGGRIEGRRLGQHGLAGAGRARSSEDCGRRPPRSRARAWRSPGP